MAFFKVNIFTPIKVLAKDIEADSLFVPAKSGQINLLPEHTHMLTELDQGVLVLKQNGKEDLIFTIMGGFCKVLKDRVTLVTELSEKSTDLILKRAQESAQKAQETLSGKKVITREEEKDAHEALKRASVRLEAISYKK